jgi:chorismate mutase
MFSLLLPDHTIITGGLFHHGIFRLSNRNTRMSAETSLDALRREIDAIDDQIHDLIMRRTRVVERVRDVKRDQPIKIRPAREAEIIYRLLNRHRGPFPVRELTAMWREMIVATLSFEGPFSVAVHTPEPDSGFWDLARDQYGTFPPLTGHGSARQVIEDVRDQKATVGILPLPTRDDTDPWWRHLVTTGANAPRIIARLPFAGPGNGGDDRGRPAADLHRPFSRPAPGRLLALPGRGRRLHRRRRPAPRQISGRPRSPAQAADTPGRLRHAADPQRTGARDRKP